MSTPTSTCFLTMSATAIRTRAAKASASTGSPAARFWIMSSRSGGRGRLPVWVVKIRSSLRFIVPSLSRSARSRSARAVWQYVAGEPVEEGAPLLGGLDPRCAGLDVELVHAGRCARLQVHHDLGRRPEERL